MWTGHDSGGGVNVFLFLNYDIYVKLSEFKSKYIDYITVKKKVAAQNESTLGPM